MAKYLGETKTWLTPGLHTCMRRSDYCKGQLYAPHCNNCYEILFVLKGSVQFDLEGEHILLKENNTLVISPMQYQIVSGNEDAYHRIILFFDRMTIPEAMRDIFIKRTGKRRILATPELTQLFQKLADVQEKEDPDYDDLKKALFTMIAYEIALDNSAEEKSQVSAKTNKLCRIIDYLDRNILFGIQIADIAEQLHMSESSIYRLFKKEMKISLKQYILQKKMIHAETLLRQGWSPGEAAVACGYRNYASFYKVFMKVTGRAPGSVL